MYRCSDLGYLKRAIKKSFHNSRPHKTKKKRWRDLSSLRRGKKKEVRKALIEETEQANNNTKKKTDQKKVEEEVGEIKHKNAQTDFLLLTSHNVLFFCPFKTLNGSPDKDQRTRAVLHATISHTPNNNNNATVNHLQPTDNNNKKKRKKGELYIGKQGRV